MTKTIEEKYKVLDELEHIRKRPGIFIGSTVNHTNTEFLYNEETGRMVQSNVTYNPGLLKIFCEVLDNSIDEHKRNINLDTIKIDIDPQKQTLSVWDNGGIPVVIHTEHQKYVPEVIFSMLRSGANYDDDEDQQLIGTNGLGSKLASIFSTYFKVETCDGKHMFVQEHMNGMRDVSDAVVTDSSKNFTRITFRPDYEYFSCSFDDDLVAKIKKRVVDCAGCNPDIRFFLNGKLIKIGTFSDYVSMYSTEYEYEENESWKIGVIASDEGFKQTSFVNSVETSEGGTHVEYVTNQLVAGIRAFIEKKHKVDVKPADIRQHMHVIISCNINRPKYISQTKTFMNSEVREFKTVYSASDKFIRKLTKSAIVESVMDWVQAKLAAEERAALRKMNKQTDKLNPRKVLKFDDAESDNRDKCVLLLVEGDSAKNGIMSGRNPDFHGVFPLRGKPKNSHEISVASIVENEEFKNILTITGLQIGKSAIKEIDPHLWYKISVDNSEYIINGNDRGVVIENVVRSDFKKLGTLTSLDEKQQHKYDILFNRGEIIRSVDMRFGKIAFATDADSDGFHIRMLLCDMFRRFWPELFAARAISIFNTPIVKVQYKKDTLRFYTLNDFDDWKERNKGEKFKFKYYKGLGTSVADEWLEYLSDKQIKENLVDVIIKSHDDAHIFTLLFSKQKGMTDKRKEWLNIQEFDNE